MKSTNRKKKLAVEKAMRKKDKDRKSNNRKKMTADEKACGLEQCHRGRARGSKEHMRQQAKRKKTSANKKKQLKATRFSVFFFIYLFMYLMSCWSVEKKGPPMKKKLSRRKTETGSCKSRERDRRWNRRRAEEIQRQEGGKSKENDIWPKVIR